MPPTHFKLSTQMIIIMCGVFGWVFMMRRNLPTAFATIWLTIFGGGFALNWVWFNKGIFFKLLGRNSTFTGRAEIWKALEISTTDKPLLGTDIPPIGAKTIWGRL